MSKEPIQFYYKSTWTTCRKARSFLQSKKVNLHERDYNKEPLNEKELKELIGERDIQLFLNTRNELVRKLVWKKNPPSKSEFIKQAVKDPNVIKRPIILKGKELVTGFKEEEVLPLIT